MDYKLFVITSTPSHALIKTDVIALRTLAEAEKAYKALRETAATSTFEITVTKLY